MTYKDDYNSRYMPAVSVQGTFVTLLRKYGASRQVFLCPSGPRTFNGGTSTAVMRNPNTKDEGWQWPSAIGGIVDQSHYGMNAFLSGATPGTWWGVMDPCSPKEGQVRAASRVIYFCDATWLHAHGYWPGLVGGARNRHQDGLNITFADGHAGWIPSVELVFMPRDLKYVEPADSKVRWDYR
jgi:prepilin-type processing-associated H-X9-DG protein